MTEPELVWKIERYYNNFILAEIIFKQVIIYFSFGFTDATEMLYRWLQVKFFHFSATSQASLSNLDEEEYFNNIEKSLSPVSFTIYFNVWKFIDIANCFIHIN